MGFTLGQKEFIINSNDDGQVALDGTKLEIKGFGTFDTSKIVSAAGFRYQPGTLAHARWNMPRINEVIPQNGGQNGTFTFTIYADSDRYEAEFANEMLYQGPRFIFSMYITNATTRHQIAAAFVNWAEEYSLKFNAELPFKLTPVGDIDTYTAIDFDMKEGFYHLTFDKYLHVDGPNFKSPLRYEARTNSFTKPTYPKLSGSYLEETVRMSLPHTADAYAINADQLPKLSGKYAVVSFTLSDTDAASGGVDAQYQMHPKLGGTRDETTGARYHKFTLYLEEGGAGIIGGATGAALFDIGSFVDAGGGALYNCNGTTPTDVADWADSPTTDC